MRRWFYPSLIIVLIIFGVMLGSFPYLSFASSASDIPLEKAYINLKDKASLQRGAKLYMNYCLGCHSLTYMRYNRMAKDIGITKANGEVNTKLVQNNLIFTGAKMSDAILSAMPKKSAKQWFGVSPPDLTLAVRIRGAHWIKTYLKSFYEDPKRPLGVNNLLYPDVAMPSVLVSLQGIQQPIYQEYKTDKEDKEKNKTRRIVHLELVKEGSMSERQFDAAVNDIVNFLAYTARPETLPRQAIGIWVILFLILLAIVSYLLKREYWKDVHLP